jgi:two-component system KDP operon response regulator KdpE
MTRATHKILVVDDDPALRRVLTMVFETNGFRVVAADTCELAVRQAQTHRPDVCIVDLGLPDEDGLNFIQKVRTWSPVPIIVLTARIHEAHRLAAFEAGADDYVIKPFSSPELLARVRAIMRRVARSDQPRTVLALGNATVDLENRITRGPGGESIKLTPLEHRILECLVRHADGVVTHGQILKEVWGPHQSDIRSLRVYVASLWRKLETDPAQPQYIVTESGIGYRLCTENYDQEFQRPSGHEAAS